MSACLCNLSADHVLELAAQERLDLVPASPDIMSFSSDHAHALECLGSFAERLPKPIELLVANAGKRRNVSQIACHTWKCPMPAGSVFEVSEGLYVTSPELTLLHQANKLHQVNLCQMLGRYMGMWTPRPGSPTGQDTRAPLTTPESLNEYLLKVGKARGFGNLRLALAYTCEGAASAGETNLQLALSLPPELHGLSISQPVMNYEKELSLGSQELYPHKTIRIDLCWRKKKFGLEYQGEEHETRIGEDCSRWYAAKNEGYELWFVTKDQLQSAAQMMHIGREVSRRIGFGSDERLWPTKEELQDLLDVLAGKKHLRPVASKELRRRQVHYSALARMA